MIAAIRRLDCGQHQFGLSRTVGYQLATSLVENEAHASSVFNLEHEVLFLSYTNTYSYRLVELTTSNITTQAPGSKRLAKRQAPGKQVLYVVRQANRRSTTPTLARRRPHYSTVLLAHTLLFSPAHVSLTPTTGSCLTGKSVAGRPERHHLSAFLGANSQPSPTTDRTRDERPAIDEAGPPISPPTSICVSVDSPQDSKAVLAAVKSIGLGPTCSLAVADFQESRVIVIKGDDGGKAGARDIISRADHGAEEEAEHSIKSIILNYRETEVSRDSGSKSMDPTLFSGCNFFSLLDYFTHKCTNNNTRSFCSTTLKCSFVLDKGWQEDFLTDRSEQKMDEFGLQGHQLARHSCEKAAAGLGLKEGTAVWSDLIDASGGILVKGVWVPYMAGKSAYGIVYKDATFSNWWMNEGGQCSKGRLIDSIITSRAVYCELKEHAKQESKNIQAAGLQLQIFKRAERLSTSNPYVLFDRCSLPSTHLEWRNAPLYCDTPPSSPSHALALPADTQDTYHPQPWKDHPGLEEVLRRRILNARKEFGVDRFMLLMISTATTSYEGTNMLVEGLVKHSSLVSHRRVTPHTAARTNVHVTMLTPVDMEVTEVY
ncbi:hypothetical protein EDD17DRAFT_1512667 [Pisolithus thermaeus]|nr:hypothetical protein EDD17DRAFT_1512667 [Pisolithus thermaeus]